MSLANVKFDADIDAFRKVIDSSWEEAYHKIILDLFARIVGNFETHRHPVDTGRARAGWGITTAESIPAPPPGTYGPPPLPDVSQLDGYTPAFILNAIPYIEPLENGHSKQAPNGFIRLAIMEVETEIETIVALNT